MKDKIIELRDKGLSYEQIGRLLGLSKQRIFQIYQQTTLNRDRTIQSIFKIVKTRDGYKCQWGEKCVRKSYPPNKMVIHHIDFNEQNNNIKNLITLCPSCHTYFHLHMADRIDRSKIKYARGPRNKKVK